ncbi:hypothetical protein ASG01_12590 [Chryseobacterium sp. Leaf180]|nr:hypothetical protein ASG01_12590 [Chryseobacterium sp. Leaf180]
MERFTAVVHKYLLMPLGMTDNFLQGIFVHHLQSLTAIHGFFGFQQEELRIIDPLGGEQRFDMFEKINFFVNRIKSHLHNIRFQHDDDLIYFFEYSFSGL